MNHVMMMQWVKPSFREGTRRLTRFHKRMPTSTTVLNSYTYQARWQHAICVPCIKKSSLACRWARNEETQEIKLGNQNCLCPYAYSYSKSSVTNFSTVTCSSYASPFSSHSCGLGFFQKKEKQSVSLSPPYKLSKFSSVSTSLVEVWKASNVQDDNRINKPLQDADIVIAYEALQSWIKEQSSEPRQHRRHYDSNGVFRCGTNAGQSPGNHDLDDDKGRNVTEYDGEDEETILAAEGLFRQLLREEDEIKLKEKDVPYLDILNTILYHYLHQGNATSAKRAEQLLYDTISQTVNKGVFAADHYSYKLVMSAWVRAHDLSIHTAALRAESLLLKMIQHSSSTSNHQMKEKVASVVPPLNLGTEKESKVNAESYGGVRPDTWCFRTVLDAWWRAVRATTATTVEESLALGSGVVHVGSVMHRNERTNQKSTTEAARRCEGILQLMIQEYQRATPSSGEANLPVEEGHFGTELDKDDDNDSTSTASSTTAPGKQGHFVHLSTAVFNAVIGMWSRSDDELAPQRAEALLRRMLYLHEAGLSAVRPNTITYNSVMDAWARWGSSGDSKRRKRRRRRSGEDGSDEDDGVMAARRVESILQRMQEMYEKETSAGGKWCDNKEEAPVRPNTISFSIVINAWRRSQSRDAGIQAERVLSQMDTLHQTKGWDHVAPNTVCYTAAMLAWARSGHPDRPWRATKLLQQLRARALEQKQHPPIHDGEENDQDTIRVGRDDDHIMYELKPSTYAYNAVIDAWSKSHDRFAGEKAEALLREMREQYHRSVERDASIKPDIISYNGVISAWAHSRAESAGLRAQALFDEMKHLSETDERERDLLPNFKIYTAVVTAWGRSGHPEAPERVDALVQELEKAYQTNKNNTWMQPNVVFYSAAMGAWSQSRRREAGERAEAILLKMETMAEEMRAANRSRADVAMVQPNTISYTTAIGAWANCKGGIAAAERAEALLQKMHDLYEESRTSDHGQKVGGSGNVVKPDVKSYSSAMYAWSQSQSKQSAERALALLQRMLKLSQDEYEIQIDIMAYNTVLNACALTQGDAGDRAKAFRIAVNLMNELEKKRSATPVKENGKNHSSGPRYNLIPNEYTYEHFFKACTNLLDAPHQDRVEILVQAVFDSCCKAGVLSQPALRDLERASPKLYEQLMQQYGKQRTSLTTDCLPLEWSRSTDRQARKRAVMNGNKIMHRAASKKHHENILQKSVK